MLISLSLLSTGCWEEIRYDPSQYAGSVPEKPDPIMVEPPPAALEEKTPTLAEVPPPKAMEPTLATLPLAWQLGDQWSFAAALYAKGLGADHYSSTWGKAVAAAGPLRVKLPPLPSVVGQQDRLPTTIAYLLETAGPELALQLKRRHDARHAALIELATKTNVLLLIYSPRNEKMEPRVKAIEQAAKAADLPAALWQPLVTMLRERAPFVEVKQSVFLLHNRVASHLVAGQSAP